MNEMEVSIVEDGVMNIEDPWARHELVKYNVEGDIVKSPQRRT